MSKLNKEAMREYQRNRRKALQANVKPECKADVNLTKNVKPDVNLCKAVKLECQNCKAEYDKGYNAGFQSGYDKAKEEIVGLGVSGDTVYEPDPVKPIKKPKVSVSKQAQPIVNSLLSGISKCVVVAHHPQCKCPLCKP